MRVQTTCVVLVLTALLAVPPALAAGDVFVRGGLPGTFGLTFGPDGMLYVPTFAGVVIVDVSGAGIVGMIPSDTVHPPEDVTFGPDGSLYGSAMFHGDVWRIAPDGSVTAQMIGPGVNPIAFNGDGRMFVSQQWVTDTLWELDPDLTAPPRVVARNLGGVKGMEFGPDGMLYAALMWSGEVVRMGVDAVPVVPEVIAAIPAPFTATFGPDGMLYVVERIGSTIQRLDPTDGSHATHAQLPWGPDNLAFNDEGRLFVSSYSDGALAEILPGGTVVEWIPGGMIFPVGLAVLPRDDGGESLFVGSLFTLREFDVETGEQLSVERFRFDPQGYAGSESVSAAGDALVLTMTFGFMSVKVWDPATRTVLQEYHDVTLPVQAIALGDDLVVVDLGAGAGQARVLRVRDGVGEVLADASDGLVVPLGLATDGSSVWLTDWATGMISTLMEGGEPLPAPVPLAHGLEGPETMAVDLDGSLLVMESIAGRLSRVDPATGSVTPLVSGLQLSGDNDGALMLPPFGSPAGVAVSSSGTVFVAADEANVIFKLTPRSVHLPAASTDGAAGSRWTTDLELHNRGASRAGITVEVLRPGRDNSSPEVVQLELGPGLSARYPDVLDALFELEGTAALRVTSLGGDVMTSARTWTPCGAGGCGQFNPAAGGDEHAGPGDLLHLIQLENTAAHRTNVGLISSTAAPTTARIDLFLADGTAVGTRVVELAPFGFAQVNDLFDSLDTVFVRTSLLDSVGDAFAVVSTSTVGASICAYASVIDNATNDGIFIPAR